MTTFKLHVTLSTKGFGRQNAAQVRWKVLDVVRNVGLRLTAVVVEPGSRLDPARARICVDIDADDYSSAQYLSGDLIRELEQNADKDFTIEDFRVSKD